MAALAGGETTRVVAAQFSIATSTVVKWSQRLRDTGRVTAGQMGGHRPRVLEAHRAFIHGVLEETPHLTLHGVKDLLAERGVMVSHDTVWRFLRREGLSFKKNAVRE